MEIVDLHTHSSYSDGLLNPGELIRHAARHDVKILSITDHDTVDAYLDPATHRVAHEVGIELVPGVEFSSVDDEDHKFHILGLFIDPHADEMLASINHQQKARLDYAVEVGDRLRSAGWEIGKIEEYAGKVITKAHIADMVINNPANGVKLEKAFPTKPTRGRFIESYMNKDQEFYVPRANLTPQDAVQTIHASGGLAILAHPVAYAYEGTPRSSVQKQLDSGLYDGLEAFYYYYSKSRGDAKVDEIDHFTLLAQTNNLLVSAGSDFHGNTSNLGNYVEIGFAGEAKRPTRAIFEQLQLAKNPVH